MNLTNRLKLLDKKFSWSFFGFLIGILGFGYAIYVDQFKVEKPQLVYDILSKTQVLDLKENLNELEIIYNGENLKEKNENLILVTIKILNNGDRDIKEDDFVSQVPFGLKISNGKIAEKPQILDASNDFLTNYLKVSYDSTNTVFFNKTQIDKDQYFTIKVLTICQKKELPVISPVGKISGMINDFNVRELYNENQTSKDSFFKRLNNDNFWIHFARFFYYLICMILFGLLVGFPLSKIIDFFDHKKKKRLIQKFRDKSKIKLTDQIDLIFEIYKNYGERNINWLDKNISDEKKILRLIKFIDYRRNDLEVFDKYQHDEIDERLYMIERHSYSLDYSRIIESLIDKKVIVKDEDRITVDTSFKNELKEFKYFIDLQ